MVRTMVEDVVRVKGLASAGTILLEFSPTWFLEKQILGLGHRPSYDRQLASA